MLQAIFLVYLIHVGGLLASNITNQTSVPGYRRADTIADKDAFCDNFDTCMIDQWITAGVLQTSPTAFCSSKNHSRLCYGIAARRPNNSQYISCYNKARLIPEFTAYVVPYSAVKIRGYKRPRNFCRDMGPYAPNPQAKHRDFKRPKKAIGEYFCSRGHLTPNGAFDTADERDLTFVVSNVALQWQKFNGGNWAAVERAVKTYVQAVKRGVYVFTGTAGTTTYQASPGGPVAPKYFWKAVCDPDPSVRQSIYFSAKNNVNDTSTDKVSNTTCFGMQMTKRRGVIECESIAKAAGRYIRNWWHRFVVPDFDPVNCGTAKKGDFLQKYLKLK